MNFIILGMNTLREKDEETQELIKNLQVFEVVSSKFHKCFVSKVISNNILYHMLLFLILSFKTICLILN